MSFRGATISLQSKPRSAHAGVAGDEEGYVVRITDDEVDYTVQPGTRIRMESDYSGEERRLGMHRLCMSFLITLRSKFIVNNDRLLFEP